jgi:hypothetical protein
MANNVLHETILALEFIKLFFYFDNRAGQLRKETKKLAELDFV